MKKIFILCCALLTLCIAHAQFPNVSTGIDLSGNALAATVQDPNWVLVPPSPVTPNTYDVTPHPFWQPTPITGTNAGWINPSTVIGTNTPGVYWFERSFTIVSGTGSFACNFSVAYDDSLVSLELIPPTGPPIPLTVVPTTAYHLSQPITKVIRCPATGTWKIRAKVDYIDALGGFLLSGYINTSTKPACDTSCKLTLYMGGVSGGPFSCGSTIKLNCNKTYDFAPQLICHGSGCNTTFTSVTLKDPFNNTPPWAATFLANNGNGTLVIPGAIQQGNYTLTYYYGVNGKICDSCKFTLNIKCKSCNCTLSNTVKINGVNTKLQCGDTVSLRCKTKYKFTPKLSCHDTITHLVNVSLHDGAGNTPSWAVSFVANLGNGVLGIPNNVSGIYTLTYYWGANGSICDSCKYFLRITCGCNCTFSLTFEGNGVFSTFKCADTIKAKCGGAFLTPSLHCDGSTQLLGFSLKDGAGNTPPWAVGYNGSGGVTIGSAGIFTLTYIWGGADGIACDSCKIILNVTDCCNNLAVNAGQDVSTCCASNGTQLNAVASGGTPPYSYSWSPVTGLNNPNIANPICNTTGTYTVTVTDAHGCRATDQVTITYSGVNCCRITGNKSKSQAYPNPFNDGFILKIPVNAVADVQVIDLHGTLLEIKNKVSGNVQMGGRLAYGAYTIVVNYNDGTREEIKIIKSPK